MRGFTIVELLVSIGIFVLMTILLVVKYGNFNQGVLLTDLAYDVAIALRTAQTYGIGVTNVSGTTTFNSIYGVHFSSLAGANDKMAPFYSSTYKYSDGTGYNTQTLLRGAKISTLCVGNGTMDYCGKYPASQATADSIDVSFKRPDPAAIFCATISGVTSCSSALKVSGSVATYAVVIISGADGSKRGVLIGNSGQISILQ